MIHDECCTCVCGMCVFWAAEPCEIYGDGKHRASAKMPKGEEFEDRTRDDWRRTKGYKR